MTAPLSDLTDALLTAAGKAGADSADALAVDGTSVSIDVLGGKLEHAERSEGVDLGLRVFVGQKQACVAVSDTRRQTIADMAQRAVAMAKVAPEDPYAGLADPSQIATTWDLDALDLAEAADEPSVDQLEELARRGEAAALDVNGVSQVQAASAGYGARRIHLAGSNGFSGGYGRTDHGLSVVAITGSGTDMERDYAGEGRVYGSDMPTPEDIGQLAGERTVARKGARKPTTGSFPVVFDERIASSLIGHLLSAANGVAISRGASWLREHLGQDVLPNGLSITENPHRPRISASRPFDGEGLATSPRRIVDNGILTGWTLDLATGRKLGMDSTANASRGTSAPPSPSNASIALTQGDQSRADLLRDMGTGLLVTSMIGSTINPNTGDYSRGATGFWIENGEIVFAVNECTIAGNLLEMLKTLRPANDARTHLSRVVPSLLVEGMTLAGA